MKMNHLLGNEPIKSYLTRAVETGALHHTLVFSGREGIGKSLFAKALAQQLLETTQERAQTENHPDLHILRPEGKSGTHSIEHLREMIDEVHKPPFEAKRKVFILFDAERMQVAAANALLKTLEEPNLDSVIILLTSAAHEILPTILSRGINLTFQPIPKDLIAQYLQEKHQLAPERAEQVSRLSNGSLGYAISLLQNNQMEKVQRILFDALEGSLPRFQAIEEIDLLFQDLEGLDFHRQTEQLLASYLMWVRDQQLLIAGGNKELLFFPSNAVSLPLSLSAAQSKAAQVKTALERNTKLSACLDFLLKDATV